MMEKELFLRLADETVSDYIDRAMQRAYSILYLAISEAESKESISSLLKDLNLWLSFLDIDGEFGQYTVLYDEEGPVSLEVPSENQFK